MKKNHSYLFYWLLLLLVLIVPSACNEKESDLGVNLQDPATRYHGIRDTAYVTACTVLDDSLRTSGIGSTIIGRYTSPVYGPSEAIYYTQLRLPSEEGINFDENCHIDSIVLNLRVEGFHPSSEDSSKYYDLHFEIRQLADQLIDTANYYSDTAFSVSNNVLYDDEMRYSEKDTLLRFKLNENSYDLFQSVANQEEFQARLKGLRIKMDESNEDAMVVISLAAVTSKLTMYYKYGTDPKPLTYDFNCGQKVGHYTQFIHDYSTTPLRKLGINKLDTIRTCPYYITPMGGTNLYVRMDKFIEDFHKEHPSAVIHYAEMILPVNMLGDGKDPDKLYAYRQSSSGYAAPIADLLDQDLNAGFDGTYLKDKGCYRMRISRHVQQLLRTQKDYGTLIVLNSRRSSALSVVVGSPIRIEFIYTEIAE